MSNTGSESHTVETDSITVTKEFTPDDLPVPAVRFQIESNRSDRATVRITENIPPAFSMDSVGFHPRYDAENWTAYEDNRIVYERLVAPGEHVETVYGLRIGDEDEATAFMGDPTVSVAAEEAPTDGALEEIAPPSESQAVRDLIADPEREPETVEPTEAPAPDATTEEEVTATDDTTAADEPEPATEPQESDMEEEEETADDEIPTPPPSADSSADEETEATTPAPDAVPPDELLETLLTAVEEADDEAVASLAQALETTPTPSVDARLDHLQARVEEIAAYEAALADFLNTRGPDGQFLPELHDRVTAVEATVADLEALEDQVETLNEDVDELSATITELETTVEEVQTAVDEEVAAVDDRVTSLEATLEEVDDELTTVSDDIAEIKEWRERLGEMFS